MGTRLTYRGAALLLGLVALLAAWPADAMTFAERRLGGLTVVAAAGKIVPGDTARLRAFLAGRTISGATILLDSPGGVLGEALDMGRLLRDRRLGTRVATGAECASACVFVFAGGVVREAEPGALLGVHTASLVFSEDYVERLFGILVDPTLEPVDRVRVVVLLSETTAAQSMARQANFLASMGISLKLLFPSSETSHLDMHWLSRRELHEFNLVNAR